MEHARTRTDQTQPFSFQSIKTISYMIRTKSQANTIIYCLIKYPTAYCNKTELDHFYRILGDEIFRIRNKGLIENILIVTLLSSQAWFPDCNSWLLASHARGYTVLSKHWSINGCRVCTVVLREIEKYTNGLVGRCLRAGLPELLRNHTALRFSQCTNKNIPTLIKSNSSLTKIK